MLTLLGTPAGFEARLGKLPDAVRIRKQARGLSGLIVLFVKSQAELNKRLPATLRALANGGSLWIAWPKKASGVATDITQNDIRKKGLASGLVDYKIAAIDATWSGLRFARRRK